MTCYSPLTKMDTTLWKKKKEYSNRIKTGDNLSTNLFWIQTKQYLLILNPSLSPILLLKYANQSTVTHTHTYIYLSLRCVKIPPEVNDFVFYFERPTNQSFHREPFPVLRSLVSVKGTALFVKGGKRTNADSKVF